MVKNLIQINEICIHYKRPHVSKLPKLVYTSDIINYLFEVIDKNIIDVKEYCWVALLTSSNYLLGISEISSGNISRCSLSIREIIQLSLVSNAVKIIVLHNHPNGDASPSTSDIEMTKKLSFAINLFEMVLEDHIILTSETYISMKEKNMI